MNYIISLLEKLACKHKWKLYHNTKVWGVDIWGTITKFPIEQKQTLICSKCGKITRITL